MPIIITAEELTTHLRYPREQPLTGDEVDQAEMIALGWLSDATQVPDDFDWQVLQDNRTVRAWVLELAGISYENPTSMTQDGAGEVTSSWADRRQQILETARAWAVRRGINDKGTRPAPVSRGSFPPAPRWPDGARGRW